jgi:hypothetical protein
VVIVDGIIACVVSEVNVHGSSRTGRVVRHNGEETDPSIGLFTLGARDRTELPRGVAKYLAVLNGAECCICWRIEFTAW